MKFEYDFERHRVVDAESGTVLYQSSKLLDVRGLCPFVYERNDFVVEFEGLPVSEPWPYRWRGQNKIGQFDARLYIIEPKLRKNFAKASKHRLGRVSDSQNYQDFRDMVVEGMAALLRSSPAKMSRDPNFEFDQLPNIDVRFVQNYDELRELVGL